MPKTAEKTVVTLYALEYLVCVCVWLCGCVCGLVAGAHVRSKFLLMDH